jgi:hypothetical protein
VASFEEIVAGLEAEWDQGEADELAAEVADRIRGELARSTLGSRLLPLVGRPLSLGLLAGVAVRGVLVGIGPDWVLVREDVARECVIPMSSVLWVEGLSRASATFTGAVAARTTLAMMLRRVVIDRASVAVVLVDGSVLTGVLDRVGADYVELALVAAGEFRRAGAVSGVRAIPLSAVVLVRRV